MKKIQMVDLYAQYKTIKKELDSAIKSVIKETAFIGGKFVENFEKEMATYCGSKFAVALNSGTDALYLALWAMGIKEGDEVITTPFTFFATAEVVTKLGAKPVFIDIDPKTFNINPDLIEEKITKKTKAIIPVDLFGLCADMEKIKKIAKKYNLLIIEDACQAIGAELNGKKAGTFGDIGCFSFFPSKNLGAWGDGGMVVTDNEKWADEIRILRNHGSKVKYYNDKIGMSSRLDGIQAAILSVKLKFLNKWNKARAGVAKNYNKLLEGTKGLITPDYDFKKYNHVFHQYTLRVENGKRDNLKDVLGKKNISSMVYYPVPLYSLKAFEYLNLDKNSFPETEKACKEVLSLPIYPELEKSKIDYIVKTIKKYV